ncbi:MAG TPA: hypothetical protein EYP78_05310 [Candidatus Omnitrophica bacterium]|nr:hypothetical protein [Candidatus Omnitrophota bacterium]
MKFIFTLLILLLHLTLPFLHASEENFPSAKIEKNTIKLLLKNFSDSLTEESIEDEESYTRFVDISLPDGRVLFRDVKETFYPRYKLLKWEVPRSLTVYIAVNKLKRKMPVVGSAIKENNGIFYLFFYVGGENLRGEVIGKFLYNGKTQVIIFSQKGQKLLKVASLVKS